jgi:hypothetical protein
MTPGQWLLLPAHFILHDERLGLRPVLAGVDASAGR